MELILRNRVCFLPFFLFFLFYTKKFFRADAQALFAFNMIASGEIEQVRDEKSRIRS